MKAVLLALALLVASAQQGKVPLPPPGNPWHAEPAPGMNCVHHGPGVDPGQACECKPTCMEGRDEEGNADGTTWRVEDTVRCRVACHPKRCSCASECEP